ERQRVRLRGAVAGGEGRALEGGARGEEDHAAAAARGEPPRELVGEDERRARVHVEPRELVLERRIEEAAEAVAAGVRDDEAQVAAADRLAEALAQVRRAEVERRDVDGDAVRRAHLARDLVEAVAPARDEHEVEPPRRELARELGAEASPCAGDERRGAVALREGGTARAAHAPENWRAQRRYCAIGPSSSQSSGCSRKRLFSQIGMSSPTPRAISSM